jgi:hypothetical protein
MDRSQRPRMSYARFKAISEVTLEHLGRDHECSKLFEVAHTSNDPAAMDRAIDAVGSLSEKHRHHILGHASRRAGASAELLKWLLPGVPAPTGSTRH